MAEATSGEWRLENTSKNGLRCILVRSYDFVGLKTSVFRCRLSMKVAQRCRQNLWLHSLGSVPPMVFFPGVTSGYRPGEGYQSWKNPDHTVWTSDCFNSVFETQDTSPRVEQGVNNFSEFDSMAPLWQASVGEVGDLPGAPDDQPLYSADGSASWLDPSAVRGTFFGRTWIESVFQWKTMNGWKKWAESLSVTMP